MVFTKFICFLIYSFAVVMFICYVNIAYLYEYYKDWLFCNFKNMSEFDYIIVGAGSAGSIVAKKLSEAGIKVLLIEAGGVPIPFFNIPIIAPLLINTVYDWNYKTVPQEHACKALKNNQSIWPAGKILGGSSRLNYMIYVLGHANDYISWFPDFNEPIVKNKGPLYIDDQYWHSKLSDAILEGIAELSYPLRNINKQSSTGFMKAYLTMRNGERWSTDRIILFKLNKAIGVEFLRNNKIYKAFAKNGVILSAGAIGTPKLLMLSGIGPQQHLEELKIKVIADLPVGQHLMDHIITGFDLITINNSKALSIADVINPYSMLRYYLFGEGPWTSAGVDIIGTFYSKFQNVTSNVPDLQIMVFPVGLSQDNGILLKKNLGIPDEIFKKYFSPLTYKTAITIAPVLLHPKSVGEIKLNSADPFDSPIINPNYLSNEEDVLTLVDGIEFIKKLIKTEAMQKFGACLYKKSFPGCENIVFDTLEYWKCYIKHLTLTTYHPGGTCRMGSVVNSQFSVYKTKNLFVVDASVFPKLPSGNTHAPVVMLAEKAAKLLIKDYENSAKKLFKCYKTDIFLTNY